MRSNQNSLENLVLDSWKRVLQFGLIKLNQAIIWHCIRFLYGLCTFKPFVDAIIVKQFKWNKHFKFKPASGLVQLIRTNLKHFILEGMRPSYISISVYLISSIYSCQIQLVSAINMQFMLFHSSFPLLQLWFASTSQGASNCLCLKKNWRLFFLGASQVRAAAIFSRLSLYWYSFVQKIGYRKAFFAWKLL